MVVAQAARDRSAPRKVLRDERPHHVILETLFLIDDVIRNAQRLGYSAGVVHIVDGATSALHRLGHAMMACQAALVPQLKGETDNVVSLLTQQGRDGGRVHTSRHGYSYGLVLLGQRSMLDFLGAQLTSRWLRGDRLLIDRTYLPQASHNFGY